MCGQKLLKIVGHVGGEMSTTESGTTVRTASNCYRFEIVNDKFK